jgi:23S rRNA (pseudouridine1915-N3)-methyltransferase
MRYQIIAVGQLKRSFLAEGCDFYLGRLKNYAKTELLEVEAKGKGVKEAKRLEGDALLRAASGYLICLDEQGEQLSSKALADRLNHLELKGISTISLLLGGAAGHSEQLKQQAQALWSLSRLTLPHELARLVLLEQLYRAETIRAGHPYHRT